MDNTNNNRGFSSNIGAILAATGGAIGLGNIWRFPYTVGENGGGAFIIMYILFVFLLGVPVMMSEIVIGRRSQQNVMGAFKVLAPKHKAWLGVGVLSIVAAFIIYAFYSVVAGWTLNYIVLSCSGQLSGKNPTEISQLFADFTQGSFWPLLYQFIFLSLTAGIILLGVQKGIEKYAKILMPILLVLMLLMCVRSVTLDGASRGLDFVFHPDFSKITGYSVLCALGQALFSLSIGMGAVCTYGSYIRKQDNLFTTSLWIAGADTFIAIMAGVAIFPAVFAFGLSPAAGPSLVYEVLPNVFNSMPGGTIFAAGFFILLSIAALTSTMSLLEVLVLWAVEELHWSRRKASVLLSLCVFVIGVFCALSFGPLNDAKILGLTIFEFCDHLTATYMMPIGALLFTLFIGWYLPKADVYDELSNGGQLKARYFKVFYFIVKYIAPLVLIAILLAGIFL
ncbi:MAG: sodium-dependent transporter [Bacteroidales bacterium]|nr:sodium-dependent transporter [Bacteroidales bacterium]